MDRRGKRSRWRRRGRRVAPPASSLSAAASSTTSPLPLPLTAGSATAGARGGRASCLAATLAATDEGPGFPFSMANGERGSEDEEEKGWRSVGSRRPLL